MYFWFDKLIIHLLAITSVFSLFMQLPHRFNGSASHLELWTSTVGCICFGEKEGPPQHCLAQPFCRWRLGQPLYNLFIVLESLHH